MLTNIFADLHIHIGRDEKNKHVKISASPQLTLTNILKEASRHKGIDLIGIIDCHVPAVLDELDLLIKEGQAYELQGGGIRFEEVTLLLGSEIEVNDENSRGPFHVLVYFPTLSNMRQFSHWLTDKMTNITLSSQRIYCQATELQKKTKALDGLFIPAHVFTPFKSLYGRGVHSSLEEVLLPEAIDAIELGLSADTTMADQLAELHRYPYLTNSDSHSLGKIGREYQQLHVKEASFQELVYSLQQTNGRSIVRNYGMNPQLGKYHRTVCRNCMTEVMFEATHCPRCTSTNIIAGVKDRIDYLSTKKVHSPTRPPYIYQVPLEYIPGLGPKTLHRLLEVFHTEMNIIHQATYESLTKVTTESIAQSIIHLRKGTLNIAPGGGGKYGQVLE